jgi:hypothetical protein
MRWKLSHIEQIVDVNITCFVRLEGSFSLDQLRSALTRVQRKHPALRAMIREEADGLYYEADRAPEIPLRIVARVSEDDYRRECRTEMTTGFSYDQPQLRAVWLQSKLESDLLLTTTHRMCDGMSVFIIVREVLRSLHNDEELIPYEPVTVQDIIGDYQPPRPWRHKVAVALMNGVLRLIPNSRRAPENNEHHLEWSAGQALSNALKIRCRAEGVSVHALLVVALERALFAMFGKKSPKAIINPIDLRRGRFAALNSDTVFYGGGNIKISTGQSPEVEFWARARAINEQIRREVEQEIVDIPSRFHFLEMLRPLSSGQIQSIVRLDDALKFGGSWNRFGLSNLGNVVVSDSGAPFRLKDLRLYVHSFSFRMFGLIPYTVNGEMRFYCVIDEKFMNRSQLDTLQREFMALLQNQAIQPAGGKVMRQKRKLSTIEHILGGNIVCLVRLEGIFSVDQLRSALSRVQLKRPALRALIREDSAPEIPLRIVPRVTEDDYRCECHTELTTDFAHDQPRLRAVWVPSELESDLLLTTSYRDCDGMSVLTIVREVLRSLHTDEELIPYEPITVQDIIGDYQPAHIWKRKLAVCLVNRLVRLVPSPRRGPEYDEHCLKWRADRAVSDALRQRCKAGGIFVHAALVVALNRALLAVLGEKKLPKWIDNLIDPGRGLAALKNDMLFLGSGRFKVRTAQRLHVEFWTRTRAIKKEIRKLIEQQALDIPSRFHFFEMLRLRTSGQLQSIIRESDIPFRLKDLRLYLHSFKTKVLGLLTYTINGQMRFYCISNQNRMGREQVDTQARVDGPAPCHTAGCRCWPPVLSAIAG